MKKLLLAAVALLTVAATPAVAENSVLRSLPTDVQKDIEETRTSCRSSGLAVTSDDGGLPQFTLGGRKAVLVDPVVLCGGCHPGYNCSNRGTRLVRVIALTGNAWRIVLSDESTHGGHLREQRARQIQARGPGAQRAGRGSLRGQQRVSDPTG